MVSDVGKRSPSGVYMMSNMTTRGDAFAKTVDVTGAKTVADGSLDATVASGPQSAAPSVSTTLTSTTRPAVLPRAGSAMDTPGERYAKKRVLGAGGMGEVVLAEDRDIGRDVALKYLNAPHDAASLARFVDEVHIVGSLEHPNIVPIHDVGRDENDRYYFVMKHVEGETLESIIEKLAAGDPAYHARYTFTTRVEIFVALARALQFAHAHGYVHRDIKPANVMIGRYGEVVLMDWGVAKLCKAPEETGDALDEDASRSIHERLFTTRRGAIVGTPAYMSPEQARGEVETIDERSDIYCACVLFHELMTLRHYLGEPESLAAMLAAIQNDPPELFWNQVTEALQGPVPAEYLHFVKRGLQKDPAARFQNVEQMVEQLEAALDGRVKVECPVTFTKRAARELGRFVDRHPRTAMNLLFGGALCLVGIVAWAVVMFVRAHA
jgi:serine/threonine protein kinase